MKYVLTPEQRARMVSGNTSEKARKGRAASPWNRGPMCDTKRALGSHKAYKAKGQRRD